jgi:hypothetical protein
MSGGAPDMNYSVSGAPVWTRLPSARAACAFNVLQVAVAPRMHRTCPVNYSGAAFVKSRGWRVPKQRLRWSTGHCPVYTGQSGEL